MKILQFCFVRFLVFIWLMVIILPVLKGQDILEGGLMDSTTNEPVQFAHVSNYRTQQMTITNAMGKFRIPASIGDTIVFSIVGYQTIGWEVKPHWHEDGITLKLPRDVTFLDEVLVYDLPPEEIFKQRLLNYEPTDTSFWYHGMEKPKPLDNAPLTEKQINNPLFVVAHPTNFLYQKFSKRAKEARKYHQIVSTSRSQYRAYEKFSRDWVAEETGLQGDELTDFMQYCDYSVEYLKDTPLYIIRENMLAKLETFAKEQKG